MAKLTSKHYTSSGTWLCPAGVTKILLLGHGGGSGGSGGNKSTDERSLAGDGTVPYMIEVEVVPNTSYSISIGAGGAGGVPRVGTVQNGGTGGNTTFGSLHSFLGVSQNINTDLLGTPTGNQTIGRIALYFNPAWYMQFFTLNVSSGYDKMIQLEGEWAVGGYLGGVTGALGYVGSSVGAGGAGSTTIGGNAASGSGYGYGGSSGGAGGTSGGNGSSGGSGQLWVIWVE